MTPEREAPDRKRCAVISPTPQLVRKSKLKECVLKVVQSASSISEGPSPVPSVFYGLFSTWTRPTLNIGCFCVSNRHCTLCFPTHWGRRGRGLLHLIGLATSESKDKKQTAPPENAAAQASLTPSISHRAGRQLDVPPLIHL